MITLTRKKTKESVSDSYESAGFNYSISYDREQTETDEGVVSYSVSHIAVVAMKGHGITCTASHTPKRKIEFEDDTLTSDDCKELTSTVLDIFDTVINQDN